MSVYIYIFLVGIRVPHGNNLTAGRDILVISSRRLVAANGRHSEF